MYQSVIIIECTVLGSITSACPIACTCENQRVDCSYKKLTTFPSNIPTATTTLELSYNEITTLDRTFFKVLTALKDLDLGENKIGMLDANVFEDLTTLEDLDLSINEITTLDANIFQALTRLSTL
ncbi:protein slit-like [Mytilus galloprovincialis]|uniref:protein slit-like n=1 Tax=Mytilus galloprovincialis TaxID=29158 RepID=UPI003F7C176B